MLKIASPHGPETENRHFSNCKFQFAIKGVKRVHIGPDGGPKRHNFHEFGYVPLSKLCFPPGAASIFSQNEARCDAKIQKCHLKAMR